MANVFVGGAQSLENADFAAALENGHDQRVDDSEGRDRKRQAAENAQQQVQNGEKAAEIAREIEQRKRRVAQLAHGVFHGRDIGGALEPFREVCLIQVILAGWGFMWAVSPFILLVEARVVRVRKTHIWAPVTTRIWA